VLLAFADRDLQESILAGPLSAVSAETITDPAVLRRKLAEVRQLGHAVAPGYVEGVSTGVAVPIRDETGTVIAALSMVLRREMPVDDALVELHRATKEIEAALGAPRR
jgi:DNA-binding IclR family transcriptional regulator